MHELENSLDIELETLKRKKQTRDEIINALHKYNDIKDATQEVLGRIAIVEGVTVAEIHRKYQLLDSDWWLPIDLNEFVFFIVNNNTKYCYHAQVVVKRRNI